MIGVFKIIHCILQSPVAKRIGCFKFLENRKENAMSTLELFCSIDDEYPCKNRVFKFVPSTRMIASRKMINIVNLISSKLNYDSGG